MKRLEVLEKCCPIQNNNSTLTNDDNANLVLYPINVIYFLLAWKIKELEYCVLLNARSPYIKTYF